MTLTDIAWIDLIWYVINSIQYIASLNREFLNWFNPWRQVQREQWTYWQNMEFDHTKHDIEQFACDLKEIGEIIGMSDDQILEHFKESPATNYRISTARNLWHWHSHIQSLVLLLNSGLLQTISSLMLVCMSSSTDHVAHMGEINNSSKPGTF